MRAKEFMAENASVGGTCSGSIATMTQPIGGMVRRVQDASLLGGSVTDEEYPNTPDWIKKFKNDNGNKKQQNKKVIK